MCLRRVDLAPILAELGRDEVHLERGVYVLLRQRGDLLTTLLGTDAVQPVLVEEKLSAQGQAAQPHVVLLRTGEIEERRAERPGRHYPQVDLQSTVDDDRALRIASRKHALDAGGPGEDLEDRRCVVARDDDVDVADRPLVAAQAPGDRELLDAGLGSQVIGHRRRGRARLMQERSAGALLQRGDRSEDVLFGFRLDLGKLLQPMLLGRFLELLDGRDLQVVVDDPRSRRADARYAQQRQETGRDRCLELRVTLRPAGRDDLLDRLADRRADLRDLLEPALLDQLGERLAKVADRPSGRAVRDRAKDVLTLELDQVADLVEDLRDGVVTDGEGIEGHPPRIKRCRTALILFIAQMSRLVFRPSPSYGYLWLIGVALVVLAPTLAIVLPGVQGPTLITLIALAPSVVIGLPFLMLAALFPTMRYELDADALTLRYGPVLRYRIPYAEIQGIQRRDLSVPVWSSLRLPGIDRKSVV